MSRNGIAARKLCPCGRPGGCGHPPFVKWLLLAQGKEPREACDACATEAPLATVMRPINRRPVRIAS